MVENTHRDIGVVREYRGLIRDCRDHISKDDLKQIRRALDMVITKGSDRDIDIVHICKAGLIGNYRK